MSQKTGFKDILKKISSTKNIELFIAILIVGVILSIAGSVFFGKEDNELSSHQFHDEKTQLSKTTGGLSTQEVYMDHLEKRLQNILAQIRGVGEVLVMITYESGPVIVTEKDISQTRNYTEEKDTQGGSRIIEQDARNEKSITVNQQGGTQPIIITEKMPEILGVLVVAEGADNIEVKAELIEAVKTILNIPSSRVKVCVKHN